MKIELTQRIKGKTIKVENEIESELEYENLDNFFTKIIDRELALSEDESYDGQSTNKPRVKKLL